MRKRRNIELSQEAQASARGLRKPKNKDLSHGLFALPQPSAVAESSSRGDPVTPSHLGKLMAGCLPGEWTAHSLRHWFATSVYVTQRDLRAAQELLGHASPATPTGEVRRSARGRAVGACSLRASTRDQKRTALCEPVDVDNGVKGSNARLSWTDAELVIEHGRISARAVGQPGACVPWSKVLGARCSVLGARSVGRRSKYVQVDIDGHTPPKSVVQDLWSICARPKDRARVIEVISVRAACRGRTPAEPAVVAELEQPPAAPRQPAPSSADPEIARLRERSAKWAKRVAWTTNLELLLMVVIPVLFGFLIFVAFVVVAAFLLL